MLPALLRYLYMGNNKLPRTRSLRPIDLLLFPFFSVISVYPRNRSGAKSLVLRHKRNRIKQTAEIQNSKTTMLTSLIVE